MELIDGNAIAEQIQQEIAQATASLQGRPPCVAFIRVGEDPASVSYVSKKQKVAAAVGIASRLHLLPETVTQDALFALIDTLNQDAGVDGILVQSPLPRHLDETLTFNRVSPEKDVDGFHTMNIGRLCQEDPAGFASCTPAGIVELLKRSHVSPEGRHVVVIGRSLIVGKPAALLLMQKGPWANATVTVCHSRTPDLPALTRQADILIAAIGRPHFVTPDMVKPGAVVIDVGINRIPDATRKSGFRLVGDVDFERVAPQCAKITPVPGGVGPMTVAMLMRNTLQARQRQAP